MSQTTTFSQTQGLVSFMNSIQAPNLDINESKSGKSMWVAFKDVKATTAILSSKVENSKGANVVDGTNARDLLVSWLEGTNPETGLPVKGWCVHNKGTVNTVASFSLTDIADMAM